MAAKKSKKMPIQITEENKDKVVVSEVQIISQIKLDLDNMDTDSLLKLFGQMYNVNSKDTGEGIEVEVSADRKKAGHTLLDVF